MTNRSPSPIVATARGRVAALSRSRTADDPDLIEARRTLAVESISAHAQKVLDKAPPLTDAQRARIIEILQPFAGGSK